MNENNSRIESAYTKINELAKHENYAFDKNNSENAEKILGYFDKTVNEKSVNLILYGISNYKLKSDLGFQNSSITSIQEFRELLHLLVSQPIPNQNEYNLGHWFFQQLRVKTDRGKKLRDYLQSLYKSYVQELEASKKITVDNALSLSSNQFWEDLRQYNILTSKDILDFCFGYCFGMIKGFSEFFITDNIEGVLIIALVLNKAKEDLTQKLFDELQEMIKESVNKIKIKAFLLNKEYDDFKFKLANSLFSQGKNASFLSIQSMQVLLDFCKEARALIIESINSPFEAVLKSYVRIGDAIKNVLINIDTKNLESPLTGILKKIDRDWVNFNKTLDEKLNLYDFFEAGGYAGLEITKLVLNIALMVKQLIQSSKWVVKEIVQLTLKQRATILSLLLTIPAFNTVQSFKMIPIYDANSSFVTSLIRSEEFANVFKGSEVIRETQTAIGKATIVNESAIKSIANEAENGVKLPAKLPAGCSAAGGDLSYLYLLLFFGKKVVRIRKPKDKVLSEQDFDKNILGANLEERFTPEYLKILESRKPGENVVDSFFEALKESEGLNKELSHEQAFNEWLNIKAKKFILEMDPKEIKKYYEILQSSDKIKRGQLISDLAKKFNVYFTTTLKKLRKQNGLISLFDEPFSSLTGKVFNPNGKIEFIDQAKKKVIITYNELMATSRRDLLKRVNSDYLNMIKEIDKKSLQNKMNVSESLKKRYAKAINDKEELVGRYLNKESRVAPTENEIKKLLLADDEVVKVTEEIFAKYGTDISNAFANQNWLDQPLGLTRPDSYLLDYFCTPHFNADPIHLKLTNDDGFVSVPIAHELKTGIQDLIENVIGGVKDRSHMISFDSPYNLVSHINEIGKNN
jgi:hypothetical protein